MERSVIGQMHLSFSSTKKYLDKEVEWFESKLVKLLNNHAKITRITAYSKRWRNEEVAEARKIWAKNKKKLSGKEDLKEELRQAQYSYYQAIREAKRLCWQKFLQRRGQQSHCWTALKYTKPLQFKATPALTDANRYTATFMKGKKALVCKSAFPKPSNNPRLNPTTLPGITHMKVFQDMVSHALISC